MQAQNDRRSRGTEERSKGRTRQGQRDTTRGGGYR